MKRMKKEKTPGKLVLAWSILLILSAFPGLGQVYADEMEYRVGVGDILKVTVYDHPDLSTTVRISGGGVISFPLIGQIGIDGMTVNQVADKIAARLEGDYIINPQVSVFIQEFRSKRVTIMGQVSKPGLYELSGPTTLLELISTAGGLEKDAGDKVTIQRRPIDENPGETITVNLKDLLERREAGAGVSIQDGDSLVVSRAGIFYVTGEVRKPDSYKADEGCTVIKAITMAGGFTNIAAKGRVKIIRKVNGQEIVLENVSLHDPVLPEDVMVVPESFF